MRQTIAVIALLILVSNGVDVLAQGPRIKPNPLTIQEMPFNWPTTQTEANLITESQVLNLLNQINQALIGAATTDSVESYTFSKLDGKSFYLVAIPGGRYTVDVVECRGNSCTYAVARSAPQHNLSREIVDIDGDGRHEIVTKEQVISYEPAKTKPIFTYYIHAMRADGSLTEVSARYPVFFEQQILPRMKATEQEMLTSFPGADVESNEVRAELTYVNKDYERRILGISTAGLAEAQQWQSSPDEDMQMLAVDTFEGIDSQTAEVALENMAQSTIEQVSDAAKGALARKASHFNIHSQ